MCQSEFKLVDYIGLFCLLLEFKYELALFCITKKASNFSFLIRVIVSKLSYFSIRACDLALKSNEGVLLIAEVPFQPNGLQDSRRLRFDTRNEGEPNDKNSNPKSISTPNRFFLFLMQV